MTGNSTEDNANEANEAEEHIGPDEGECISCGTDISDKDSGTIDLGEYGEETDVMWWTDDADDLCWLCIESLTDWINRERKTPEEMVEEATPEPEEWQ